MQVLAAVLKSNNSPTKKFYTIILAGRIVAVHYGPGNSEGLASGGRINVKEHGSVEAAFRFFNDQRDKKSTADYRHYYTPLNTFDMSDSNVDPTDMRAFVQEYYDKRNTVPQDAAPVNNYMQKMNTPVSSKPRTAAKVKTEDTSGMYVSGKVVRPNGEAYIPRWLGKHHDVAVLRNLYEKNIFVRVYGPPGGGKTALVEAAFPDAITINGHGDMTVAHFVGSLLPTPSGGWTWGDGPLTRAMREGKILFVDEITRVPTEVLSVLYSTLDGRNILRIDDRPDLAPVHAAEGFGVIAGYNPDTLGARALDEALVSRFRIGIEVTTDYNAAKRLKVPTKAITVAKNLAQRNVADRNNGGPGVWVPQMRELLTFRDLINAGMDEEFAANSLLGACPVEDDQGIVADVIKNTFGFNVNVPTLGKSV